jgi:PAS domain S-box-containing protein
LSSADWIWEVDRNGRYTYASGRVKEILGYEPKELLGKTVYDLMPKVEANRIRNTYKKLARGKRSFRDMENFLITKSGKNICVVTNGIPILDSEGKMKGYRGVTKDITEFKKSDERMRFLQFSMEHMEEAAYWMGPDARFIYVNESACNALGYPRKELLKMKVHDIDPDFPEDVWSNHWNEVKKRKHFRIESRHKKKSGEVFPVEISINYLEFEGSEYNFAFARDISERKAAEEILIEGEARLQQIINQMPYPIEVCDPDGTATLVNEAFLDMMGVNNSKLIVGNYNIFKDSYMEELGILSDIERVYNGESVFLPNVHAPTNTIDANFESFRSGDKHYELTMFPVQRPNGELWRVVSIWKDVTAQKIAEQHLIDERNKAELYLDILSHDVSNLNQAIISSNELLLMKEEISDEMKKYTKTSLSQARAMSDLIRNVRRLTKIGIENFEQKKMDVYRVLDESIARINEMYPDEKITINHSLPESGVMVSGNELLGDVLDNLLINSVKFNREEEIRIEISHLLSDNGKYWKLQFSDNGPGVPDEMKKVIFKRLERGEESIHGSGLGLTIVNEVINQIGGKIWVEDKVEGDPSQGSSFIVMLPKEDK